MAWTARTLDGKLVAQGQAPDAPLCANCDAPTRELFSVPTQELFVCWSCALDNKKPAPDACVMCGKAGGVELSEWLKSRGLELRPEDYGDHERLCPKCRDAWAGIGDYRVSLAVEELQ
jgi:hypothetical protein